LPETALVTGATGFIGSALCRALLAAGHPVHALHRRSSSLTALEGLALTRFVGDILSPDTLPPAMQGVEWVFHAAGVVDYWRKPDQVIPVVLQGTRNVVTAARQAGVRRLVLTSSMAAMGVPKRSELLTEEHTFNLPAHHFRYGYAKRQAELEALRIAEGATEVVVVNPSAVFGAGDLNQISGSLLVQASRLSFAPYFEGGWNVVHVDDVVEGHLAAARQGGPGQRYILGGENITHRETLAIASQIVGRAPRWVRLPGWIIEPGAFLLNLLRRFITLPLDGDQLRLSRYYLYADISKAQRELGLGGPRSFRQAAQEAYDWYVARGIIPPPQGAST